MSVPITPGTGASSVAGEVVSGLNYQQIEVYGKGGASVLGVNPDGSINASIIGSPTVTFSGSPSISGAVTIVGTPNVNTAGSVVAFQGGTQVTSLVSTVPSSVIVGASIFGQLPAGNAVIGAVAASISGTVTIAQSGTVTASVVSSTPSSMLVGASIYGQLPAGTAPLGSVATLQGTVPWIISSVYGNVSGSVVGFQGGAWSASIVGAPVVADNTAWAEGNVGVYTLRVRNDTMSSVSGADVRYSPAAVGPVGETISANAPITKWIQGTADLRTVQGASVTALAAQGTSIFTYVTAVQIANFGPSSVLVTLTGGLGSILGYTIAPAGGGSNIVYPNALKTGANSAFAASINGTASVLVSAQGFISKI